jgi:hypothetical protein
MSSPGPFHRPPPVAVARPARAALTLLELGALALATTLITCGAGAQERRPSLTPAAERPRLVEHLGVTPLDARRPALGIARRR